MKSEIRTQQYEALFALIDEALSKGALLLAIDGAAAAGKSTLGQILKERYACQLFHADDFFLRPEQRTAQRLSEPGGNMDRERLKEEILKSVKKAQAVTFRPFDCKTMSLKPAVTVEKASFNVIEGAYSMHPELAEFYDLSVFLDIDPELQRQRIIKRNGPEKAEAFFSRWIPMEQRYFEEMKTKERCSIIIEVKE